MRHAILSFLFIVATSLNAQLEVNPQLSLTSIAGTVSDPSIGGLSKKGAVSLGADVFIGGNQLIPVVGAFYHGLSLEGENGTDYTGRQLSFPFGLAYRLREPSTSFNLVGIFAAAPAIVTDNLFDEGESIFPDRNFQWQGRIGAAFYFDYVTFHFDYWIGLSDRWENRAGDLSYVSWGLGVRF